MNKKYGNKKEMIMSIILGFLILLFVFIVIFVISNKDYSTEYVNTPDYLNDVDNYVIKEEVDTSNYLEVYNSVNLYKVSFKNISSLLVNGFITKEEEYLNSIYSNIDVNKNYINDYIKENNILNYKLNSKIDSTFLTNINDGFLSVLYLIEEEVDYKGINNYIVNIMIDIKENSILSNIEVLNRYNLEVSDVISLIYDNYMQNKSVEEDYDNFYKLLSDNFDDYVYLYVYYDNLYLKYNKSDIERLINNTDIDNVYYSTIKLS